MSKDSSVARHHTPVSSLVSEKGLGFRVEGFRVKGSKGLGFRAFKVEGFRVKGSKGLGRGV